MEIDNPFDMLEKHLDVGFEMVNQRFAEIRRILLQIQSELIHQNARLNNLEGRE